MATFTQDTEVEVLKGISLKVDRGQCVAVMAPNGQNHNADDHLRLPKAILRKHKIRRGTRALQRESYSGRVICTIGLPIKKKGKVNPQFEFVKENQGTVEIQTA